MFVRFLLVTVLWFCGKQLFGQKEIVKELANTAINTIEVNATNVYNLNISTTSEKRITIAATLEGEYSPDLVVSVTEQDSVMVVSANFQPNFIHPNDKLSAHKVISIQLTIAIPEQMNVGVLGYSTEVDVRGKLKALKINLNDGNCQLSNVKGKVKVTTHSGHITLKHIDGSVNANSRYGKLMQGAIPQGKSRFKLTTVLGNIFVNSNQ